MIIDSPSWNKFQDVFKAHEQMNVAWEMMNKTSTAIMGKKFYSEETKKIWQVVNIFDHPARLDVAAYLAGFSF